MRLPPVDVYRAPFIAPIGHLAMQSAHAEDALITLCASIPFEGSPDQVSQGDAAHRLRHWNDEARAFIANRVSSIGDPDLRKQAEDAIERYASLRVSRHRAIHDAVEVGIHEAGDAVVVHALSVEYRREKISTSVRVNSITPEMIADLACEMYDVHQDLKAVTYSLRTTQKEKR
ncbi:hypothetical protein GOL24_24555 [Sinorhizobium medicae]|nr:hypothetical protein [Sinorhizobium medicae]MDX1219030.1 hypothetical protein [Sinorhizobium medicae]